MPILLHRSCAGKRDLIPKALYSVFVMALCLHEVLKAQKDLTKEGMWPEIAACFKTIFGKDWELDIEQVRAKNNFVLFYLFAFVRDTDDPRIVRTSRRTRPRFPKSYQNGPTFSLKQYVSTTASLLGRRNIRVLHSVNCLRKHDTRTVVIRCAGKDMQSTGPMTLATSRGCLITLYPCAFQDPTVMSDVKPKPKEHRLDRSPASSIDVVTSTLAGHIYHELTHDKWAGGSDDIKLLTKNVPPGFLRLRKNLITNGKKHKTCYGREACRALAKSVQAREAHRNADSLVLTATMVFQTCVYPELNCSSCFFEPRTSTSSPGLLNLRWDEWRHKDFDSIKDLSQYQELVEKSKMSCAVEEPLSRAYVPKRDSTDPKDACWRHPKDKGKYKRW